MKEQVQNNYPFLTCINCNNSEYVGILVNYDSLLVSIYDMAIIPDVQLKKYFLEVGEIWWWESNRKIPINIFLKEEMSIFRPYIKTFNSKDVKLVFGPKISLSEIGEKRIKRKSIQLIKSVKSRNSAVPK